MNLKLKRMGEAAARSASLEASAAENEELATITQEHAAADEGEAATLQEEAGLLLEKSDTDAAAASKSEAEAGEVEAEIIAEEEQSAAHAAIAAVDEGVFEGEMAEATADAGEASRLESQARGEEVIIGFCELAPFLDVACDVVGGISVAGLEVGAAAEAVKAASEFATAASAKAEEDEELAAVAEIEAKTVDDGAVAAELHIETTELFEMSTEEKLEGEADEKGAKSLFEQSAAEEETATEEEGQATAEEEQAEASAQEALMHGAGACWDALVSSAIGLLACGYFVVRVFSQLFIQGTIQTRKFIFGSAHIAAASETERECTSRHCYPLRSFARDTSYVIHHCAVFFLSMTSLGSLFSEMINYDARARGGLILTFAIFGASVQALVLHSVVPKGRRVSKIFCEMLQQTLTLTILFTIELLTLLLYFGTSIFSLLPTTTLHKLVFWAIFAVTLTAHLWFFELQLPRQQPEEDNETTSAINDEESSLTVKRNESTEDDALLKRSLSPTPDNSPIIPNEFAFKQEMEKLFIPFDFLALSCMFLLLKHCIPLIQTLWPAAKPLLLSSRPDWLIPTSAAYGILVLGFVACNVFRPRRRPSHAGTVGNVGA